MVHHSRRDLTLKCPLLQSQAVEVDENGISQSGSSNSTDDHDLPNLSYVTDGANALLHSPLFEYIYIQKMHCPGSYSDGDAHIYHASLGSQASEYGFDKPMAQIRREPFQSSYDPEIRMKAGPNFKGHVCPQGHMCRLRLYRKSGRFCDECDQEINEGSSGERCKLCDYDLCPICSSAVSENVQCPSSLDVVPVTAASDQITTAGLFGSGLEALHTISL